MAISPPGDIVLDVIRAADPARVEEARSKLLAKGVAEARTAFEVGSDRPVGARLDAAQSSSVPDSYREFEALVLQTFLQSMWPADAEAAFGKGTAGEMWKGMMSEHLGRAMAQSGGIGIARQLAEESASSSANGAAEELAHAAGGLVDRPERNILRRTAGSEVPFTDPVDGTPALNDRT